MSAILYAAGPRVQRDRALLHARNIDIAPTILEILGWSRRPPSTAARSISCCAESPKRSGPAGSRQETWTGRAARPCQRI